MTNIITTTVVGLSDIGSADRNSEIFSIVDPSNGSSYGNQVNLQKTFDESGLLLTVCRGIGDADAGEKASRLTIDEIKSALLRLSSRLSTQSQLEAAIEAANFAIWKLKKEDPKLQSMQATVAAVLVEQNNAYIAGVGDCHAYIMREGYINRITANPKLYQILIQKLVNSGAEVETVEGIYGKNLVERSIGKEEFQQVAVTKVQLIAGDILLLCTDSLHQKLLDSEIKSEIQEILRKQDQLSEAAEALVRLTKDRGTKGNITLILARVDSVPRLPQILINETDPIQAFDKFDSEERSKIKQQVRPATFEDILSSAVVDHFALSEEQRQAMAALGDYGEFEIHPKGNKLVVQGEPSDDCHYWLISGRYRVVITRKDGTQETVAFIVPPTDKRTDQVIQGSEPFSRVKRQFFTASFGMLSGAPRNATIKCEDDSNAVIRVSRSLYERISAILGERFVVTVRHC